MCGSKTKLSKTTLGMNPANYRETKKMKVDFINTCKISTKQYTDVLNKGWL